MKKSIALMLAVVGGIARAQGLVIPTEPDLPPLALTRHHVKVAIDRQAAITAIEQDFFNSTERELEGQYVFPIPGGAAVTRFTMLVNGKETSGEIVEKNKARSLYNDIVSRSQDPGLLEYLGNDLFRASIFPIAPRGTQTITLRLEHVAATESSIVRYVYPIRQGMKQGPSVNGEFRIEVSLRSAIPIVNVYSPSHSVSVERAGEREAKVTYVERHATLSRDFQLYYGVSERHIGLDLVAYRPDPKEPGAFMMLVSPRSELQSGRIVERDVVFVLDTSGSMAGEKIQQAKKALQYCVAHLNERDRFAIVPFSSEVRPWKREWVHAVEYREAALAWIDPLEAAGGTNIAAALDAAFSFPRTPSRPFFVVFMTDGKPTVGETTDSRKLIEKVQGAGTDSIRLFTWGVGYDVDTQLLDGMASIAGGVSEYVHPEEDIAVKVAAFYNKTSHPVLTHLTLENLGEKVQWSSIYPKKLPDLYAGGQVVVFGQYTGDGDVALRLSGRVNDKTETFTYETKFPSADLEHKFIESLWARRRIGFLLDEIRSHGESKELVDEVVRLSMEHGIQTPYTSFIILEDGALASASPHMESLLRRDRALERKLEDYAHSGMTPLASGGSDETRREQNDTVKSLVAGLREKSGKDAVDVAGYVRGLKEAEQGNEGQWSIPFKKAAGVRFCLYRGLWVDDRFQADHATMAVKFGSAAYFKLLETHPELIEVFKLGPALIYVTAFGQAVVIGMEGEETVGDERIAELFTKK